MVSPITVVGNRAERKETGEVKRFKRRRTNGGLPARERRTLKRKQERSGTPNPRPPSPSPPPTPSPSPPGTHLGIHCDINHLPDLEFIDLGKIDAFPEDCWISDNEADIIHEQEGKNYQGQSESVSSQVAPCQAQLGGFSGRMAAYQDKASYAQPRLGKVKCQKLNQQKRMECGPDNLQVFATWRLAFT